MCQIRPVSRCCASSCVNKPPPPRPKPPPSRLCESSRQRSAKAAFNVHVHAIGTCACHCDICCACVHAHMCSSTVVVHNLLCMRMCSSTVHNLLNIYGFQAEPKGYRSGRRKKAASTRTTPSRTDATTDAFILSRRPSLTQAAACKAKKCRHPLAHALRSSSPSVRRFKPLARCPRPLNSWSRP